jgi:hypothetical protein
MGRSRRSSLSETQATTVEPLLADEGSERDPVRHILSEDAAFFDSEFLREYERLARLAATHLQPGVHLNDHLDAPLENQRMVEWQNESNRLAGELKGRRDLVKKRRFDVPRWTSGPDLGMPYVKSEFAYLPEHGSVQNRVFRTRDELEWLVIPTIRTTDPLMPWRPIREVLTHDLVRAILDWKASHLDMYLWAYPHLIGGRICHELPGRDGKGRQHVHEVKFSTVPFMKWYFANMN